MLRPRIIPCLLIHNKGLVKTTKFSNARYIGDPLNAVKIFNEKEVDELIVLDIDATIYKTEPNYNLIERIALECQMPLCYGGGIKSKEQANRIISLGVEKVSISSAATDDRELIASIAQELGSQSVVGVIDVKKKMLGFKYEVWTHNATKNTKQSPFELIEQLQKEGVGEIVLNSIDKDGSMSGYDIELVEQASKIVNVPLTVLGGASSLSNIKELVDKFGVVGASAGSLFVYKGALKAVLINYPDRAVKEELLNSNKKQVIT